MAPMRYTNALTPIIASLVLHLVDSSAFEPTQSLCAPGAFVLGKHLCA